MSTIRRITTTTLAAAVAAVSLATAGPAVAKPMWWEPTVSAGCSVPGGEVPPSTPPVPERQPSAAALAEQHRQARLAFVLQ